MNHDRRQELRIVSLFPAATEIVCGIGLGDRLVGVSHECNWPPTVAGLPRVTRSHIDSSAPGGEIDRQVTERLRAGLPLYEVDARALAALRPRLILAQSQCDVCAIGADDVRAAMQLHGATHAAELLTLNPQSLDETIADIARIRAAGGATEASTTFAASLLARVQQVRRAVPGGGFAGRPRTALLEWLDPLMIAGNWVPAMVEDAGGDYGLASAGAPSRTIAFDELGRYGPEVLVIAPCGFDLERSIVEACSLKQRKGWTDLPAVRSGNVYVVDGDAFFNRPGPRQVDALETLASVIRAATQRRHEGSSAPLADLPPGWQRQVACSRCQ